MADELRREKREKKGRGGEEKLEERTKDEGGKNRISRPNER